MHIRIFLYSIYIYIPKSKYLHTQICTCVTMHKYTHMRYTLSHTYANYTQALGSTHERATAFVALGRLAVAVKLVDWIVEYRGQGGGRLSSRIPGQGGRRFYWSDRGCERGPCSCPHCALALISTLGSLPLCRQSHRMWMQSSRRSA